MALDLSRVGTTTEPEEFSWDARDTMLYALGVGAGTPDPTVELEYTTEHATGHPHRVLPTFMALYGAKVPPIGDYPRPSLLHAGQGLRVARELPASGRGARRITVTGMYDLGNAALVTCSTALTSPEGSLWATATAEYYIRDAGGFGGDRAPRSEWALPDREPDAVVSCPTFANQALVYRLCSDRNPIHSDPVVAQQAGFDRPILHGLSTFGVAGRAVARALADVGRGTLAGLQGRFTGPVWPGEELRVEVWVEAELARFRVVGPSGRVVFDRGEAAAVSVVRGDDGDR
jgi:acyl dehydratase